MNELIFTAKADSEIERLLEAFESQRVCIVTDTNTEKYCLPLLPSLCNLPRISIDAGEKNKNIDTLQLLWRGMSDYGLNRRDLLINIGGGMVSDIGGFAAATYMRGIRYINMPTSLLAAVDASTGGKTAIDFGGIKNLVGAFHRPNATIISPEFFATLPRKEILSGYGEMIKHALLDCHRHLDCLLSADVYKLTNDEWLKLVRMSVDVKRNVVLSDPYERGERRKLNLGHTAGHALEALCLRQGRPISHGHAVALGILAECRMNAEFLRSLFERLCEHVFNLYEPVAVFSGDKDELGRYMLRDKKNQSHDNKISYVRMVDVGRSDIFATTTVGELTESLLKTCGEHMSKVKS